MTYGRYVKRLVQVVLSSTLVLSLIIGIPILFTGDEPATGSLTLEFDAIDGLFIIIGLPLIAAALFIVFSPLSYFFYKLMRR